MRRCSLLPILAFCCFARLSQIPTIFSNSELHIDFGAAFAVREKPGLTEYPDHLPQPVQTIDFCPWQPQPPHVQQVSRPERGFLCELHILPAQPEREVLTIVEAAHKAEKRRHVRNFRLESVSVGAHRVVRWRFQVGKTRLDHLILIGKKYNYLFVSSPYGSNGTMEDIIRKVKYSMHR